MTFDNEAVTWKQLVDDDGQTYVDVHPDLVFPRFGRSTSITTSEIPDIEVEIGWAWSDKQLAYVRQEILLRSENGISVSAMHALARSSVLNIGLNPRVHVLQVGGEPAPLQFSRDYLRMLGEKRPTNQSRIWVARVYVWARAIGRAPARTVQDYFGIEKRTATRWIADARERGLIDVAEGDR